MSSRTLREPPLGRQQAGRTVRDLSRMARDRGQDVPLLLAVTILVETLSALDEAGRRDVPEPAGRRRSQHRHGRLTAERIGLGGPSLGALLDDPTRDPRIEITGTAEVGGQPDLHGAGAVFVELLTGAPPRRQPGMPVRAGSPDAVDALVRGLLAPGPDERLALEEALAASRALGLELLAAWDRKRRRARLEEDLKTALESRLEPEVKALAADLADLAPESPWVGRARGWIDVRSRKARHEAAARRRLVAALYRGQRREVEIRQLELEAVLGAESGSDPDLAVSWGWLREQDERDVRRQEEGRKVSLKLLLTGAPLIFATFLTGLLAVVMWLSG